MTWIDILEAIDKAEKRLGMQLVSDRTKLEIGGISWEEFHREVSAIYTRTVIRDCILRSALAFKDWRSLTKATI